MVSLKAPRFDNVLFLQGLSERVRHFKLKCVAGFCSKRVFATLVTSSNSASRPFPFRAGRVSLYPRQPTLSFTIRAKSIDAVLFVLSN